MPRYRSQSPDVHVADGQLTDEIFAAFCHLSPNEARERALRLPEALRAQLAVFCYGRAHLRPVGIAIAAACSEASLIGEGGNAGRALFARNGGEVELESERPRGPVIRITLATAVFAEPAAATDFEGGEGYP